MIPKNKLSRKNNSFRDNNHKETIILFPLISRYKLGDNAFIPQVNEVGKVIGFGSIISDAKTQYLIQTPVNGETIIVETYFGAKT